jgi:hypothetical protein
VFLAAEDIARLTGFARHSAQAKWLSDHRYRFEMNAGG